jgi:hypothetical protein
MIQKQGLLTGIRDPRLAEMGNCSEYGDLPSGLLELGPPSDPYEYRSYNLKGWALKVCDERE